jgi:hypothetical protein
VVVGKGFQPNSPDVSKQGQQGATWCVCVCEVLVGTRVSDCCVLRQIQPFFDTCQIQPFYFLIHASYSLFLPDKALVCQI